jgi:hypothetical protein
MRSHGRHALAVFPYMPVGGGNGKTPADSANLPGDQHRRLKNPTSALETFGNFVAGTSLHATTSST